MQHSFVRMRAIVLKQTDDRHRGSFGFWMTLLLMICLIGGLGTYIIYSYLPNSAFDAAQISPPPAGQSPELSMVGTTSTAFKIGQRLTIAGSHFGAHDTITFLLDTVTPITGSNGSPLRAQADAQGAFEVSMTIGQGWSTGNRIIEAVDTTANTSSSLVIQVLPASQAVTSSPDLSITLNGETITTLTFTKRIGQPDPDAQRITITNTSGSVLNWSAGVITDNNVGWLIIEDNNYTGQLAISEPQEIGIGVNTNGLGVTPQGKPYTGEVLFTINNDEVLTLRVQLTITNAAAEMVFSPTPIIATANADGSCQAGATLTLINLGSAVLVWSVNPDLPDFIYFVDSQGKPISSGALLASGTAGDTVVLTLQCKGVRPGQYHISIYGNSMQASDIVEIQET